MLLGPGHWVGMKYVYSNILNPSLYSCSSPDGGKDWREEDLPLSRHHRHFLCRNLPRVWNGCVVVRICMVKGLVPDCCLNGSVHLVDSLLCSPSSFPPTAPSLLRYTPCTPRTRRLKNPPLKVSPHGRFYCLSFHFIFLIYILVSFFFSNTSLVQFFYTNDPFPHFFIFLLYALSHKHHRLTYWVVYALFFSFQPIIDLLLSWYVSICVLSPLFVVGSFLIAFANVVYFLCNFLNTFTGSHFTTVSSSSFSSGVSFPGTKGQPLYMKTLFAHTASLCCCR